MKGERFESWRSVGLAIQVATVHAKRGVDELLILDIAATAESRGPDLDMVRELSAGCFVPITVGGGVRSLQDIDDILRAGGDKVCIGTGFYEVPGLVRDAAARFGSQAIVVSVDARANVPTYRCGKELGGLSVRGTALFAEEHGAGEILLSSVDRDGTMTGYDLGLIRAVSQAVSVPVIASGGCSGYEDMDAALHAGADCAAAGALYAFTDCTPRGAAKFLKAKGWEVRL